MTANKHTPGQWVINEVADEPYRSGHYWVAHIDLGPQRKEAPWPDVTALVSGKRMTVTVAPCLGLEGQPVSREVIEANAHLIAAAPDMLEALVELLDASNIAELPTRQETDRLVRAEESARAAIKKARGEP